MDSKLKHLKLISVLYKKGIIDQKTYENIRKNNEEYIPILPLKELEEDDKVVNNNNE